MKKAASTIQTVALVVIALSLAYSSISEEKPGSVIPQFAADVHAANSRAAHAHAAAPRLKWEQISSSSLTGRVHRSKLPGGWLVSIRDTRHGSGYSMIYIPDAMHAWDGSSLPKK